MNFNLSWQRKLKDGRKVGHVAPAYVYECKCSGMVKNLQLLLRVTVVQYIKVLLENHVVCGLVILAA